MLRKFLAIMLFMIIVSFTSGCYLVLNMNDSSSSSSSSSSSGFSSSNSSSIITSANNTIFAFGLTSALNSGAGINNDVTGIISNTNINLTVPYGAILTNLIAVYSNTGVTVKIGSNIQTSGVTANNFTSPVIYTVTAADGSTRNYAVTVTIASSSAKAITAFSFTSALNGALA